MVWLTPVVDGVQISILRVRPGSPNTVTSEHGVALGTGQAAYQTGILVGNGAPVHL